MSARRWLIAVTFVTGLGVAAAAARWWAGEEVTRVLQGRDLRWAHRTDTFGGIVLQDVTGPALTAQTIEVTLIPAPTVVISGVEVDLDEARTESDARTPTPSLGQPTHLVPPVEVVDLRVRWGDDIVVRDWQGTLFPAVRLAGPGGALQRMGDGTWNGSLDHPLDLGPLSGDATVQARCGVDCTFTIDMPEAVLAHTMLAAEPLPSLPLHAALSWADGALDGTIDLGSVRAEIRGTLAIKPTPAAALTFEIPDTPLSEIIALFGDLIPESRRARVVGTIGASGTVSWPDLTWSLTPRTDGLGVEGVLVDTDGLRNGQVTWATLDAEGVPRMHRTGRGLPRFVPFPAAGLFPAAVLAAEDSGFSQHNGLDLVAVQAAIDDARDAGVSGMRGGSTITQQLAKNLFLDTRERTLVRKLRELLYALELDRVLPKERILELYINVVELGADIYGVGHAADAYFLKQPARLTVEETVFLAALLPAPRTRGERAWRGGRPPLARMAVIIDNMRDLNRITPAVAAQAKRSSLRLVPPP